MIIVLLNKLFKVGSPTLTPLNIDPSLLVANAFLVFFIKKIEVD